MVITESCALKQLNITLAITCCLLLQLVMLGCFDYDTEITTHWLRW